MSPRWRVQRFDNSLSVAHMLWAMVLFVFTLFASSSHAGYEFSISASNTDPHANVSAPTNALRNVYLWLTCTDEGISAMEGDVFSNQTIFGFTPLNGVINAGGSTALLLAVPGCPFGEDVNFLLGYWIVWDSGTDVCLTPSAQHGILGAVSCEEDPTLTENPQVVGFTSSGGNPCSVGMEGCEELEGTNHGSFGT